MPTIQDYLSDTAYTPTSLLNSIWKDHQRIEKLKDEIENETNLVNQEYNAALAMQMYGEDPDDAMAGVGRYWENYFGADKELYNKNEKLKTLTILLAAHELSINQLSGNLLEHAKKGLSLVYGNPKTWPTGKMIGSQALSKIIIESRNQSAHIDEAIANGGFKKADVAMCFNKLENEINTVFKDYLKRDMSFDVIQTMGWIDYNAYSADIANIK